MTAVRWSRSYGWAVPFAVLALVVAVDIAFAPQALLAAAYPIAAVAAAAVATVARTVVVAVAAVLLAALSGLWNHNVGSLDWVIRLLLAVALGALAVVVASIREQRESQLRHMTVIAETAQRAMLRVMPAQLGAIGLAARYVSATDAAFVGGDLYEVADTRYGVRLIMGDVRGKGLAGVQMASTVLAGFRRAAAGPPALAAVARELDALVQAVGDDEDFVTAVLAEFYDDHALRVVNCGHHPPLLVDRSGAAHPVDTGEPFLPLGMGSAPRSVRVAWPAGARLLFYTDGLAEARDRDGEFFPLGSAGPVLARGDLGEALDALLARVGRHTGEELDDDMGLVLAEHRTGRAARHRAGSRP